MRLSQLTPNTSARERCPYCHDSLGEVERVACEGCGTPHHPVCLEELGGCTVLGCAGGGAVEAPVGPVEEIRRRVRERAARFAEARESGGESEEAIGRRMAGQPRFCTACEREVLVVFCPQCEGRILPECAGDSVHCARESCRSLYSGLEVGTPITFPDFKKRFFKPVAMISTLIVLGLVMIVAQLTGAGPGAVVDMIALPFVLIVAGLLVFGPLLVMMVMTKR